ncbi:MAG TPA: trigger factor, partial [Chitinophagaceae bacterium]|nr:trigger factor [Chitinophagaceae bacterium]
IKKYAKTANIPGFRKGMVPAGLIKKMYGQGFFNDEVLRTVEKQLNQYMNEEKLEIFAQPLPLENDARMLDMNQPRDYAFAFEIGLKPRVEIDLDNITVTKYKVQVTEEIINDEANRLQIRFGKMTEPETVTNEDNVLNLHFEECDADGNIIEGGIVKDNSLLVKYFAGNMRSKLLGSKKDDSFIIQCSEAFEEKEREWVLGDLGLDKDSKEDADKYFKITITKIGFVEKAEMQQEFFDAAYPGRGIQNEEEFRNAVKAEIENYYEMQSRNQVHDQIYHHLVDHTDVQLPENFLKRWLQSGGDKPKSQEEAETEYPVFEKQLRWTLVSTQLITDNNIIADADEIKESAKQQLLNYMGGQIPLTDDAPWIEDYANRMMKDEKFVQDTYMKIQTSKLFALLETKVNQKEESITAEEFAHKQHHHHH